MMTVREYVGRDMHGEPLYVGDRVQTCETGVEGTVTRDAFVTEHVTCLWITLGTSNTVKVS